MIRLFLSISLYRSLRNILTYVFGSWISSHIWFIIYLSAYLVLHRNMTIDLCELSALLQAFEVLRLLLPWASALHSTVNISLSLRLVELIGSIRHRGIWLLQIPGTLQRTGVFHLTWLVCLFKHFFIVILISYLYFVNVCSLVTSQAWQITLDENNHWLWKALVRNGMGWDGMGMGSGSGKCEKRKVPNEGRYKKNKW